MHSYFCLSVTFLDAVPAFHGRADGGDPEWPPSPLRLFQALVVAAAARWRDGPNTDLARAALRWLAAQGAPIIAAPPGHPAIPIRIAVPNNDMDIPAAFWAQRREPPELKSPQRLKAMKTIRPTRMVGCNRVHYFWPLGDDDPEYGRIRETLFAAARNMVTLGWGVDLVAGNGEEIGRDRFDALCREPGREVWREADDPSAPGLRIPTPDTLLELTNRHAAFLNRLNGGYEAVPPLSAFRVVGYRRPTDAASRPFVAFELRTPDFELFRPFDPTRHTCAVAGMVRNALADLARQMRPFGWTDADINTFVHGHTPDGERQARGPDADHRFAYLPLPSLERRGGAGVVVTAIRRMLVVGPPGGEREVAWARVLSGRELTPLNNTPPAALRLIDKPAAALRTDPNLGPYVRNGVVWSTVTPVVLPGFDDGNTDKAERLLRKAFEQAGAPPELVRAASLEVRRVGFRAGVGLATRYTRPEPTRLPRYHVRVRWPAPVGGPLFVGASRYRGLGVFATEGEG